jgi:hypothetical protein
MYQTDFICTYKFMDDTNDQEQMYRIQILQAFDLNEWDDDHINNIIMELYTTFANVDEFKEIFKKARANKSVMEMLDLFQLSGEERLDENDIIFKILFKFEYFDLLHRCIVDYLLNNSLSPKYMDRLLNDL